MKRDEADDSSCFVVGFSLYPVILALEVFVLVLFFKNSLLILRQSIENFDITGFLNQMIFLKKKLEEKIETYNIFIVKKIDLFNLHVSSGTNLYFDIGCPSEQKKIEYACYI